MDPALALKGEMWELVELAGRLARERFASRAAKDDAAATFPFDNYEDLRQHGLLGLTVPKEYGGLGADPLTYSLILLQISKGCASTGLTFNMHAAREAGVAITQLALRLCGGRGILKSFPLERYLRDALSGPVMPPSNDRCLETIGKLCLGLEAATLEFT